MKILVIGQAALYLIQVSLCIHLGPNSGGRLAYSTHMAVGLRWLLGERFIVTAKDVEQYYVGSYVEESHVVTIILSVKSRLSPTATCALYASCPPELGPK